MTSNRLKMFEFYPVLGISWFKGVTDSQIASCSLSRPHRWHSNVYKNPQQQSLLFPLLWNWLIQNLWINYNFQSRKWSLILSTHARTLQGRFPAGELQSVVLEPASPHPHCEPGREPQGLQIQEQTLWGSSFSWLATGNRIACLFFLCSVFQHFLGLDRFLSLLRFVHFSPLLGLVYSPLSDGLSRQAAAPTLDSVYV